VKLSVKTVNAERPSRSQASWSHHHCNCTVAL